MAGLSAEQVDEVLVGICKAILARGDAVSPGAVRVQAQQKLGSSFDWKRLAYCSKLYRQVRDRVLCLPIGSPLRAWACA